MSSEIIMSVTQFFIVGKFGIEQMNKASTQITLAGALFHQRSQSLGIGKERARQIVRENEAYLKSLGDPLRRKIEELSRPGETKRILNALRGSHYYNGDPGKLTTSKPEDIRKINGLGLKSVSVIAKAFESMGVIGDAEKCLGRQGQDRFSQIGDPFYSILS